VAGERLHVTKSGPLCKKFDTPGLRSLELRSHVSILSST